MGWKNEPYSTPDTPPLPGKPEKSTADARLANQSRGTMLDSFLGPHRFLRELQGNLLPNRAGNIQQSLVGRFQLPFQVGACLQRFIARVADLLQLAGQLADQVIELPHRIHVTINIEIQSSSQFAAT
jgi:hypothetical protein